MKNFKKITKFALIFACLPFGVMAGWGGATKTSLGSPSHPFWKALDEAVLDKKVDRDLKSVVSSRNANQSPGLVVAAQKQLLCFLGCPQKKTPTLKMPVPTRPCSINFVKRLGSAWN